MASSNRLPMSKKFGWIWRAVALKHFCRYNSYYFVVLTTVSIHEYNTNSVRSGQTDPNDCGTHTYDAAARLLIAKTVANESKT